MKAQSSIHKLKQELVTSLAQSDSTDRSRWIEYIIECKIPLEEIIDLLYADYKIAIKFSWMIGSLCEQDPMRVFPIVGEIFDNRDRINLPNFDRSIAKMFYYVEIPQELEGQAVDLMFSWLLDPNIIVSTKNYSLFGLFKLTEKYSDLKIELKEVIEDQLDKNSNSFKKRASKILQKL